MDSVKSNKIKTSRVPVGYMDVFKIFIIKSEDIKEISSFMIIKMNEFWNGVITLIFYNYILSDFFLSLYIYYNGCWPKKT